MTDSGLECETVSTVDELLGSDLKAWILHDVFEEHFDELEFCVAHFLQRHAHPTQTLRVLANGIEARLLAHLDALALAGPKAVEKVTASLLEEVDPNDATRVSAGVLALAGLDLTNDAFESPEPAQAPGSDGAESNVDLEALPPLEEEDLEADLVPPPEDAVPRPNADAIGRWWAKRGPSMRAATRHVLGEPCTGRGGRSPSDPEGKERRRGAEGRMCHGASASHGAAVQGATDACEFRRLRQHTHSGPGDAEHGTWPKKRTNKPADRSDVRVAVGR